MNVSQGNPPAPQSAGALPTDTSAIKLKSSGLLNYIWLAMGFGFLALLTPCVFPMIPITVSFFTKREQRSHGAAIKQALVYCFGIIFTFTGTGPRVDRWLPGQPASRDLPPARG